MENIDVKKMTILEETLQSYSIEKISNNSNEVTLRISLIPQDGFGRKKVFELPKNKVQDACIAISINYTDNTSTRHILGIVSDGHFVKSDNESADSQEMINTMLNPGPKDELYYIPATYLFMSI